MPRHHAAPLPHAMRRSVKRIKIYFATILSSAWTKGFNLCTVQHRKSQPNRKKIVEKIALTGKVFNNYLISSSSRTHAHVIRFRLAFVLSTVELFYVLCGPLPLPLRLPDLAPALISCK